MGWKVLLWVDKKFVMSGVNVLEIDGLNVVDE